MHVLAAGSAVDPALSNLSDNLVLGMILVYAVALFLFVFEAAYGRRQSLTGTRLVAVGASEAENSDLKVSLREQEPEAKASRHVVGKIGMAVTAVGLLLNLAQIVTRGLAVGRWPWGNMFEFVIAICLCGVAAFLFAALRYRAHYLGAFVLVRCCCSVSRCVGCTRERPRGPGAGLLLDRYPRFRAHPGDRGVHGVRVRDDHLFAGATHRSQAGARPAGERDRRQAAQRGTADRIAHRMIVLAFPLWTFGVIAGAIWADEAWAATGAGTPRSVVLHHPDRTPPTSTRVPQRLAGPESRVDQPHRLRLSAVQLLWGELPVQRIAQLRLTGSGGLGCRGAHGRASAE